MDRSAVGADRRRAKRRILAAEEPLAHAKLRTGGQLVVLDASNWGALTETTERLLPGRQLDVHLMTHGGRVLVRGRVVRTYVCRLLPDVIYYRAALAFEQPIDAKAAGYALPAALAVLPPTKGTRDLDRGIRDDIVFDEGLAV